MTKLRPSVFIGSSTEGLSIAQAIQVNLDRACEVVLWSQGVFGLSNGTLETLAAKLAAFDFAILVISPDDMITSRDIKQNAPRDNVLIELGMFIGSIGAKRTFFVYDRSVDIKIPSDLAGITPATFQPHADNNLQASLGAATTLIQNAINSLGKHERASESFVVKQDTTFQIIHDLLDASIEQYIILMHEQNVILQRNRTMFGSGSHHEYWKKSSTGSGTLSVDDLCRKLPDAGILTVDLRDNVSLTLHGREFAKWLIERGHKAIYFASDYGGWGVKPKDESRFFEMNAAAVAAFNTQQNNPQQSGN
jgi:Predicted nucleotide-binding protein containing TIR-like domain